MSSSPKGNSNIPSILKMKDNKLLSIALEKDNNQLEKNVKIKTPPVYSGTSSSIFNENITNSKIEPLSPKSKGGKAYSFNIIQNTNGINITK